MKKHRILLICLTCLGLQVIEAQIIYTARFTRLLQEADISYAVPVENYLHVAMPPQDEFMSYDLVLENDKRDLEIRYRFQDAREAIVPAAVSVAALLASIASNDPETEIRIQIPGDSLLVESFNAEKGLISYFTPKWEFSEKPHGAMINLYRNGRPAVDVIILYSDQAYDPRQLFQSIRYK